MAVRTSENIWSNCFKSGSDIPGTSLKNGMQSKIARCSISKSTRSTISYSLTEAIMALIQNRVSVGVDNNGNIWAECRSRNVQGRIYVLNYMPVKKKLTYFITENGVKADVEIATDTFAHWSVFVPRIAEILLTDTSGEFADYFREVKEDFEKNGFVKKNNAMFILNDYLYQTREEYIQENGQIEKIPVTYHCAEDVTDKITGGKGVFEFLKKSTPASKAAQGPKSQSGLVVNVISGIDKIKQMAKAGELELPWNRQLTPEEERLIPQFDLDIMKLTPEILKIAYVVWMEHASVAPVNNIILYGEAGAGKSTAAKLLAQVWGLPYRFINLSLNSEESELIGTYRPKEDGTFEFYEPAFAQTYRKGGVIELMEVTFARPGALGVLNSALDDTSQLTLGNGEVIDRHPNCIIVVTTNLDYEGCKRLNESFKDRFHELVQIRKMDNHELVQIAMHKSGNTDEVLVAKLVDAVQKIAIKMQNEQITGGVCSTRQLINWARDIKYTGDPIESAQTTILPGVSFDPEIQKEIVDTILRPLF